MWTNSRTQDTHIHTCQYPRGSAYLHGGAETAAREEAYFVVGDALVEHVHGLKGAKVGLGAWSICAARAVATRSACVYRPACPRAVAPTRNSPRQEPVRQTDTEAPIE